MNANKYVISCEIPNTRAITAFFDQREGSTVECETEQVIVAHKPEMANLCNFEPWRITKTVTTKDGWRFYFTRLPVESV